MGVEEPGYLYGRGRARVTLVWTMKSEGNSMDVEG